MTTSKDNNQGLGAFEAIWNHPVMRRCIGEIESVAGYRLSPEKRQPFLRFHAFVTSVPPPSFITAWRSDPRREMWHHRLINGVLGNVQNTLACVWYHRDNLCAIEDAVRNIFIQSGAQQVLGNSTIALGNTIRWDAEYQAFVLSVRRCLDYLSRALAAYFQNEHHSFRSLPKFLSNAKPAIVASALADAHKRHRKHFEYVLSDSEKKSIRDILSHYEYISAGTLNLNQHGFLMAGGGENLKPVGLKWEGGLSVVITNRANDLQACVSDILTSFVAAAVQQNDKSGT
jgi:hypothetical protein